MTWVEELAASKPGPRTIGPVSRTDFVRYQGASGDMNPVHHDEIFARKAGYDAPLGVGMFQAGVMNIWAAEWLGPHNVRRTRIRWKRPIFPGAVLTFDGELARGWEDGGERHVEVVLSGTDADGVVVVQGWMTFVVPGSSA